MKSTSLLFISFFVLTLVITLSCEKQDIAPSPISSILGDYDVIGNSIRPKRMKIISINDSIVDIRVLSNYPDNLILCDQVYKNITIVPQRSPWLVDSVFYYIYNNSHDQVGQIRTPKAGTYFYLWGGLDSISNRIIYLSAIKR
jgi:hypothetical protein